MISHYTRIAESFYEIAWGVTAGDLQFNVMGLLELAIGYPFPPVHQRGCANAIASWIAANAKLDGLHLMKVNELLLGHVNKKGLKRYHHNF